LSGVRALWGCAALVCSGGGGCAGPRAAASVVAAAFAAASIAGGVLLGTVSALSWWGEVPLGGRHIIIIAAASIAGGVLLGAVPALSWWGEVPLGGRHIRHIITIIAALVTVAPMRVVAVRAAGAFPTITPIAHARIVAITLSAALSAALSSVNLAATASAAASSPSSSTTPSPATASTTGIGSVPHEIFSFIADDWLAAPVGHSLPALVTEEPDQVEIPIRAQPARQGHLLVGQSEQAQACGQEKVGGE